MHRFTCSFTLAMGCFLIPHAFAGSQGSGYTAPQKMLLSIDQTGALRDMEPPALKAIAGLVADALTKAGYEVHDAGALNGIKDELRDAQRNKIADSAALAGFSHLLRVSIEAAQEKPSPVGFSLSIGDSDPRSPEFQKAMVTPIRCTLVQRNAFREQGHLVQDKQVPRSTSSERWSDAEERAYARNVLSVCYSLLAELELTRHLARSEDPEAGLGLRIETTYVDKGPKGVRGASPAAKANDEAANLGLTSSTAHPVERQAVASAKTATAQPKSEQEAGILPAVKVKRSSKRKQITIFNEGDTLILELGNNRR